MRQRFGGSIFGEDWGTELWEFEKEERSPSFFMQKWLK